MGCKKWNILNTNTRPAFYARRAAPPMGPLDSPSGAPRPRGAALAGFYLGPPWKGVIDEALPLLTQTRRGVVEDYAPPQNHGGKNHDKNHY